MLKKLKANIPGLVADNRTCLQLSFLGLTLLALFLRLIWLDGKSLWTDEADSVYFARHTWSDLFWRLCDPHPPFYYALLKLVLWFGDSEWVIRLPSVLAGTVTVPLLGVLCLEALSRVHRSARVQIAWQSAFWLAVSPLHVWYSQEARMYALVALLGVGAGLFAVQFAHRRHWKDALAYVILATAAMYTDWTALLPLLAANLLWGALEWPRRPKTRVVLVWFILQILVGIAVGIWWSQTRFASHRPSQTFYQWTMVMRIWERLGPGRSVLLIGIVVGLGMLVVVSAGWTWYKRGRSMDVLLWMLAWMIIGLFGMVTIVSAIPRLFTVKRLLVGLLPWIMPGVAWAWGRARLSRLALIVGAIGCLMLSLVSILVIPKEPWREAIVQLLPRISSEDVVWVDEQAIPPFDYYSRGIQPRRVLRAADLAVYPSELFASTRGGRIWLVVRVDRNRNLLDAFPLLSSEPAVWAADWPWISVRAYDPADLSSNVWVLNMEQVRRLQSWPSALDEACR